MCVAIFLHLLVEVSVIETTEAVVSQLVCESVPVGSCTMCS